MFLNMRAKQTHKQRSNTITYLIQTSMLRATKQNR